MLYDALRHHSLSHLQEASHVSTLHIVDVAIGLSAILHAVFMNIVHDVVKLSVNLLAAPAQTLRVLAHLKTRYRYATSVGSLARRVENFCILEHLDSYLEVLGAGGRGAETTVLLWFPVL